MQAEVRWLGDDLRHPRVEVMVSSMKMNEEEYQYFNELLDDQFGLHFPKSKREILESRLRPRLEALQLRNYMEYYLHLQYAAGSEQEFVQLAQAVTNNESYFFREDHQFEAIFGYALRELKDTSVSPNTLRFLCAGCSTGEEAYTLNIYSKENLYQCWDYSVEIDAIDIDTNALGIAEKATYGMNSFRLTDPERLKKYFKKEDEDHHSVKDMYRNGVMFSWGNILNLDTYRNFLPYDVIFCRNVLIYFSESSLARSIDNFARSLKPGGFLFLGHSESIIGITAKFKATRLGNSIAYRRVL